MLRETGRRLRARLNRPGTLRKIVRTVLLVLLILAVTVPAAYFISLPRAYAQTIAADGTLKGLTGLSGLRIDPATGAVSLKTGEGVEWRSNPTPEEAEAEEMAKGIHKMTMLSQLAIRYVDADNRVTAATTYANALDSGRRAPDISGGGDRYRVVYEFLTGKAADGLYLTVTVEYALLDGLLQVRIPYDGIRENEKFKLLDVSVLPYFGAGSPEDTGYLLLPDGNGAAIDFNVERPGASEYAVEVYGRDPSLRQQVKGAVVQPVSLPFLGIRRNGSGLLAIAAEGDALATARASASGMNTRWNNAYFTFRYREYDNITLNEMSWSERTLPYVGGVNGGVDGFTVLYSFLPEGRADEADMAAAGRRYLTQKYGLEPAGDTDMPLYVDLYMSTERTKAVLGLPVNGTEVLTTFSQAIGILERLNALHGGLRVRVSAWRSGENRGRVSDAIDAEASIGGRSGLDKLIRWAAGQEDVLICPAADFTAADGNGGGFVPLFQASRSVSGSISEVPVYLASTKLKSAAHAPGYYLNPAYSRNRLERFAGKLARRGDAGLGIAVNGYGRLLYSDAYASVLDGIFARQPSDRAGSAVQWQAGLKAVGEDFDRVMLDGANAYALPFASDVTGIPLTSSEYLIFTREVPFLQMTLSGLLSSGGDPVNMAMDPEAYLLRCLQGGTAPAFAFTEGETSLLKNSRLDRLHNTRFSEWEDGLAALLEPYRGLYAEIGGKAVTGWRTEGGRTVTTFEGGRRLEIDYAAKTAVLH